MSISIGKLAPNFTLQTDKNEKISLADFRGKKVILYFYPKDDTPGCTREACDFRDSLKQFHHANATILGISKDSVQSHQKFKQKYELPFILLSDEKGETCEKYGVWVDKTRYGKTYKGIERTTFLIDEDGKIAKIWPKVKVEGHIEEILETLN